MTQQSHVIMQPTTYEQSRTVTEEPGAFEWSVEKLLVGVRGLVLLAWSLLFNSDAAPNYMNMSDPHMV